MTLLTPELTRRLRVNAVLATAAELAAHHEQERRAAKDEGSGAALPRFDPEPVVKFFNPVGAATWLATELHDDGDTLFGLADLGFGCPELGVFSLGELEALRLPFGLAIERDEGFATRHPLSVWADTARAAGSIVDAEQLLRRLAGDPDPDDRRDPELPQP